MTKKRGLLIFSITVIALLFISIFSGCALITRNKSEVSVSIDYENVLKEVPFGTELNLSGLEVRVKLSDGTFRTIPRGGAKGYSVDAGGYDKEMPGEYTIKISYNDHEESFVITVLEEEIIDENERRDVELLGIEVKKSVGKRLFLLGEDFSTQGIVVERVFSDGTREEVAAPQYEVDDSKYKADKAGEYTITIRYYPNYNMSDTYTVVVIKPSEPTLISITIKTDEAKTEFLYGENFVSDNLIVEKHFDNDGIIETELAAFEELVVDDSFYNPNELGSQVIVVSIDGTEISSSYEVVVIDFVASITTQHQTNYYLGDEFNAESISVFVTTASGDGYQDDMEKYTIDSSNYNSQEVGSYEIVVYMTDNPDISTTFTINVNEPI